MSLDPEPPDLPTSPLIEAATADAVGAQATDSSRHHQSVHTHCENCGTALNGPFCHQCGQHDIDFHRSFGHMFLEALENFLHFDAKLFRNIVVLLFAPGRLPAEFNAGKRASQMPPFRLYLFVSVLFFFLIFVGTTGPDALFKSDPQKPPGLVTSGASDAPAEFDEAVALVKKELAKKPKVKPIVDPSPTDAGLTQTAASEKSPAEEPAQDRQAESPDLHLGQPIAHSKAGKVQPDRSNEELIRWVERQARRAAEPAHQRELIEAFFHGLPRMLLFCLPLFALYTRILFRKAGQLYLQHLIVALHFHTFIYLWVLCRNGWSGLTDVLLGHTAMAWVLFACNLWLALYPLLMLRRLFANSWKKTLVKTVLLALAYGFTLGLGIIVTGLILVALV